ncbi:MAG: hypothetical protein AB8A37_00885 [Prochlorococcus sp.]
MTNKPWFTANIHAPGTGLALALLALTQIPIATEAVLRVYCVIDMQSNVFHNLSRASNYCNGG